MKSLVLAVVALTFAVSVACAGGAPASTQPQAQWVEITKSQLGWPGGSGDTWQFAKVSPVAFEPMQGGDVMRLSAEDAQYLCLFYGVDTPVELAKRILPGDDVHIALANTISYGRTVELVAKGFSAGVIPDLKAHRASLDGGLSITSICFHFDAFARYVARISGKQTAIRQATRDEIVQHFNIVDPDSMSTYVKVNANGAVLWVEIATNPNKAPLSLGD